MATNQVRVNFVQQLLRVIFGAVPVVAGLDKFFNVLTDWTQYVNPTLERLLPFSASSFMHIVGVIEIGAGLVVLSPFAALGAYIVSAWLALIAISLVASGKFLDVAVRDLVMSAAAYSLAVLSEVREEMPSRSAKLTGAVYTIES
jgi:uncharacterized membrane protein YphA (DoxX/SURF4 family)